MTKRTETIDGPDNTRGFPIELTLYLTDEEIAAVRAAVDAPESRTDLDAVSRFVADTLHRAIAMTVRMERAVGAPRDEVTT